MNSIKRQAASKARQNKQQQGDSTGSLSADEKLSCDFRVPVIIVKVHSAYSLIFMRVSGLQACAQPESIVSCVRMCLRRMVRRITHADKEIFTLIADRSV